jgi:glycosyltransferase involved in cell wall biosynthesis
MARIAVCSSGIPHESRGASLVLFYHYIARLRREGHEILHAMLLEGDVWPEADIEAYRRRLDLAVAPCRAPSFVARGRFSHHLREAAVAPARDAVRGFAPDALVCLDLLPAWAMARLTGPPRLVWLGDLNFETIWWHAVYAAREDWRKSIHLPGNWLGCGAWRRVYRQVLADADDVIVASHSSIAALAKLGIRAEYEPYPWPETTGAATARTRPAEPTFIFFGALAGLGTRSALHFLLGQVYPRLRREWGGGFRILLAGSGALPDWAEQALEGKPEVKRLGFVPDLDPVLGGCHAALFPIDVPVGNRSRILTAMAKGLPVIAHRNCALGNSDLVDGETALLAADADDFAERMRRIFDSPALADSIAARAHDCYRTRFHPDAAGSRLVIRLESLLTA